MSSPTIRDVADRAGVSKSLVSMVLRGEGHVSEARRRAVLAAVDALGYRPNPHARALVRSRSSLVGVLLHDLRNPWFVDLLEGLTATLHGAGLEPVLLDSRTDQRVGRRSVRSFLDRGVDAFVVVGTTTEGPDLEAAAEEVPVVLAGTREPHLDRADVVVDDDLAGGRAATEHLLSLGHRRIAHLRGPGEIGELRLQGYRDALTAAGVDPDGFVEIGGRSEESGYAATRRLLTRAERPTAIFAFNDIAALGAMSAAADERVSVPRELSVVGYDDTYLARIRHISLTSVDNGNFTIGVQAGRFLLDRLADPGLAPRLHLVPTELHVRATSASAPAGRP